MILNIYLLTIQIKTDFTLHMTAPGLHSTILDKEKLLSEHKNK